MRILNFGKFVLNEENVSPLYSSKKLSKEELEEYNKKGKIIFDYEGKTFDFTELYKKLELI